MSQLAISTIACYHLATKLLNSSNANNHTKSNPAGSFKMPMQLRKDNVKIIETSISEGRDVEGVKPRSWRHPMPHAACHGRATAQVFCQVSFCVIAYPFLCKSSNAEALSSSLKW